MSELNQWQGQPGYLLEFRSKGLAILRDDTSPSARSALVAPADGCSTDLVNQLLTLSGGVTFVAIGPERAASFFLGPMSRPRTSALIPQPGRAEIESWNICESVEAREGVTTGISAADRARTISILGETEPSARKLVKPGHIFPIQVREGGLLVRNSLPEGACDLVRLAGFTDAALLIEALNPRGDYLSAAEQEELAKTLQAPLITLSALTRHRLENEALVYRAAEARLPTQLAGELRTFVYRSRLHHGEHLALVKGEIAPDKPVLTRVQPEFTFADVFGGDNPPSRAQIKRSLQAIGERECGVFVYLRRASEGQLSSQISRWEQRFNEKPASMMREYGLGAQILRDLGVRKVELLTGSKKNLVGLKTFGIEIVSQLPLPL